MKNNTEMPAISFGKDTDYDTLTTVLYRLGDLHLHIGVQSRPTEGQFKGAVVTDRKEVRYACFDDGPNEVTFWLYEHSLHDSKPTLLTVDIDDIAYITIL